MITSTACREFLELSAELVGFDLFDLFATGEADSYLVVVQERVDRLTFEALLTSWNVIKALPKREQAAALRKMIFDVEALRAAAQRIMLLWYTGTWYDAIPYDGVIISAQSYIEALMWKAIEAHPMAAKPQGYGAWAQVPRTIAKVRRDVD